MQRQQNQNNFNRDDDDDEAEDPRAMMLNQHHEDLEPSGFEGPQGALVQEAKRLMQEDEDDAPAEEKTNAGPKLKMGKIGGRRGKKGADAKGDKGKRGDAAGPSAGLGGGYKGSSDHKPGVGFTE